MAPTQHEPEKTKVGEEVLDLVIPYIHNVEDRNSVSLVSRKCYATDGITRKHVTVHTIYYPNPASLCKRFPFIDSLTLKGPPSYFDDRDGYVIRIAPWIQQLALEFRCLKELHFHGLAVHDEDLETLVRTRGKDLRILKIKKCKGFSTDGSRHVSNYCNQLRTLCLENSDASVNDGWLHQLALNSTVLERLKYYNKDISVSDGEDLALLAKNCSNSLISLKIGECYLSKLGDAFRYSVRLEQFAGYIHDNESMLVGFQFPPNIHSLSGMTLPVTLCPGVLPLLNQIRKLKLEFVKCHCLLFKRCPNLEVLYTWDVCKDRGLQVIGQFCKKLRKLTHKMFVTHVGLIALAKGCTKLECLNVSFSDISNEALECVGTQLKNLRDFRIWLGEYDIIDLPLDNGVRAMLMGCSKLERLDMHGGLTDVGLEYIGKYGANLRSLCLGWVGNSNAGLVKLSEGCPKLRKLKLIFVPFSEQVVTRSVFNIPSLRYAFGVCTLKQSLNFEGGDCTVLALTRPEFEL